MTMPAINEIRRELLKFADKKKAVLFQRYFKTGKESMAKGMFFCRLKCRFREK